MTAEMVRAVLEGNKTQYRSVVKPKKCHGMLPGHTFADEARSAYPDGSGLGWILHSSEPHPEAAEWVKKMYPGNEGLNCPYGDVGDRLWVKEAWHASLIADCGTALSYKATNKKFHETHEEPWEAFTSDPDVYEWVAQHYKPHWMSPVHMPRWASRLLLEIVDVRVERLADISEDDAIAEGIHGWNEPTGGDDYQDYWCNYMATDRERKEHGHVDFGGRPIDSFKSLWEKQHGPRDWTKNEWVWRVEFKVIERDLSQQERLHVIDAAA